MGYFRDFYPDRDIFAQNGTFSDFSPKKGNFRPVRGTFAQNWIFSGVSPKKGYFRPKCAVFEIVAQNGATNML